MEYNVYLTFGTMPSLYSEMSVFLDKTPSFLFVRSAGNFDCSCLDKLKHVAFYYKFTGGDLDYMTDQYKQVRDILIKTKKNDHNAKFIVYIDDSRVQYYLKPFSEANALDDISKIIILSEGNASKFMYYNLLENDEVNCAEKWNQMIEKLDDKDLAEIGNYAYWLSTKSNVVYELPYFKLLKNNKVPDSYRKKMHIRDFNVQEMFNKLKPTQKKHLYSFNDIKIDKSKKYLIIMGTNDFGDLGLTFAIIENLIDQIYDEYSDYILLYKSHPISRIEDNTELLAYFKKKKIALLPSKIPLELMLWEYDNISVGGFSSSTISLIEPSRVKFIFGPKQGYCKLMYSDEEMKQYNVLLDQIFAVRLIDYDKRLRKKINDYDNRLTKSINDYECRIVELERRLNEIEEKTKKSDLSLRGTMRSVKDKIKRRLKWKN